MKGSYRVLNCEAGTKYKTDWILPPLKVTSIERSILENGSQDDTFSRALSGGPVLDQGSKPACVGFSGVDVLADTPEGRWKTYNPLWLYEKAKLYDMWPGENYSGTSISGACEALRKDGAIQGQHDPVEDLYKPIPDSERFKIVAYYQISLDRVNEIKKLLRGERLWISILVYPFFAKAGEHLNMPEEPFGKRLGGHAMTLTGYKTVNGKLYWQLKNSWGEWWGKKGYSWVEHDLLKKLIHRSGLYYIVTKQEEKDRIQAEYDALSKWEKFKLKFWRWWNSIF